MKITSVILFLSILITSLFSCAPAGNKVVSTDPAPTESSLPESESESMEIKESEESTPPETQPESEYTPQIPTLSDFTIVYDSSNNLSFIPKLAEAMGKLFESKTNTPSPVAEDESETELEILLGKCSRKEYKSSPTPLLFRDFFLYFENNKMSVDAISIYGFEQAINYILSAYGEEGIDIPEGGLLVSYDYGEGEYAEIFKNYENPCLEGAWMVNVCHRGDVTTNNYPENSIPAYQSCIDNKVDVIETDLKKTSDGVWVICHDTTINRTALGGGTISQMTYDQVKAVYLKQKNGGAGARVTKYRIPSLEEIIDLCKGKVLLNLDHLTKDMFDDVYSVFEAKDAVDIAMFKSGLSADELADWFCGLLAEGRKLPLYSPMLYDTILHQLKAFSGMTSMVETTRDRTISISNTATQNNIRLMCLTALSPNLENPETWTDIKNRGYGAIMTDSPIELSKFIHAE